MKKRIMAVLLALVLCMGLAAPAFAADSDFTIKKGVLTEYNGSGGAVTIPAGVTSIGPRAFEDCAGLTSVIIPAGVVTIGKDAFRGCAALTSVVLPNGVVSIGDNAFRDCSGLIGVSIPNSVTSIGKWAFMDCSSLTSLAIPPSVTAVSEGLLSGCSALTTVAIPNGVTSIGNRAFYKCGSLSGISIPGSVTSIGDYAFYACSSIKSLTIAGVTSVGFSAFSNCSGLASITFGSGLSGVDLFAFDYCASLKDIYYAGTEDQWSTVKIENYNGPLNKAEVHYNIPIFGDLAPNAFYADAVTWAVANGVTTGKTEGAFAPNESCTHGQILTFLWRAAGEPVSSVTLPFATTGKEYYLGAAKWAYEKGMIDADFNDKAPCTRADAVTYIWQAFGSPDTPRTSQFTDVAADAAYAQAVAWAVKKGVTTGATATAFNPGGVCNRGQIVTFLYRAYQ